MYNKDENKFGDVNLRFEDHRDLFEPDNYHSENDYFPDEDPNYAHMIRENDSYEAERDSYVSDHSYDRSENDTQISKNRTNRTNSTPKNTYKEEHTNTYVEESRKQRDNLSRKVERSLDYVDESKDLFRGSIEHFQEDFDDTESPQVKVYQEVDREKPRRKRRNNKKKKEPSKQKKSGGIFSGGIPFAYKVGGGIVAVILLIVVGVLIYWDRKPPQVTAKNQSIDYGSSLKISEMVSAKDNRAKNVTLTIDSIKPDGATISDDGKSVTFSKVGTYTVSITGTDDFKNKTTAKTIIDVIDYIAPTFTDIADSYSVGYGQPVSVNNTAVVVDSSETTEASTEVTDTSEATDTTVTDADASETEDTTAAPADTSETEDTTAAPADTSETEDAAAADTSEATATTEATVAATDPNYTINVAATDDVSKNVGVSIVSLKPMNKQGNDSFTYQEDKVIFKKLGAYEAVIQATDDDGNATAKSVTINVVDKTAPKITKSEDTYTVAYGVKVKVVQNKKAKDKTNIINVTAKDAKSDVKLSVASVKPTKKLKKDSYTLKKGAVTFHKIGTYKVTICATDEAKNKVTQEVKVKVVDETEPVLHNIPGTITLKNSATAYDWTKDVTATDEIDGDLTDKIKVDDSAVQFGHAGTYKIRYSVKDEAGNKATDVALVVVQKKATPKKTTKATTATKKTTEKKKNN